MRIIARIASDITGRSATVYRDTVWQEYRVKFFACNGPLCESADYHSDDRADALETSTHWVTNAVDALGL